MRYFSSDWHLNHKMTLERGPWNDMNEMNSSIIDTMCSSVKKGDVLFFLGDLGFNNDAVKEFFNQFEKTKAQFVWVLGNHDMKTYKQYIKRNNIEITMMKDIKSQGMPITLSHYPMVVWNKSHYNAGLLHGHIHRGDSTYNRVESGDVIISGKQLNINFEFHNYKPLTEDEVLEKLSHLPDNKDLIRK
jgi:calcineurin-like phosphoesterase family protein